MPLLPEPTVAIVTTDRAALASLELRLAGVARLVTAPSLDALRLRLRLRNLTGDDSLVIDLRRTAPADRERVHEYLAVRPPACRLLVLDRAVPGEPLVPEAVIGRARLAATMDEPVDAYAAALQFGEGHHGVLIAAMRALAPTLSDTGRRAMYDVLAERFACRNVSALAERWAVHRTRLHHLLLHRGDPTPKHLFDWCHTMVVALLLRHTDMSPIELARFVRARHSRIPGEAVRRRTGLTLAQFRREIRQSLDVAPHGMVLQRLGRGAA